MALMRKIYKETDVSTPKTEYIFIEGGIYNESKNNSNSRGCRIGGIGWV